MTQQPIKIKNLTDIVKLVPEEALDSFLVDLKSWVLLRKKLKIFKDNSPVSIQMVTEDGLMWINDGKNDIKVTLEVVDETNK